MGTLAHRFRIISIGAMSCISAWCVAVHAGSSAPVSTVPVNIIESNQADAWLGYRETSVGDVNGDGYGDVIVSAYGYDDNGLQDQGAVFLYLGTADGLSTTPAAKLESNQAGAAFGRSVASAGDVNGDGYADVIIGAHLYSDGESEEGAAFLYLGSASGLSTTPSAILEGNQAGAWFGYSVASAGDVNGDGYDDVIVGAFKYDGSAGEVDEGAAFVYLGSPSGISTTPVTILECHQASASFGISVANVGDVNGDGYDDVMVGAIYYDNGHTQEGAAFLYTGSASGLSTAPVWQQSAGQDDAFMGTRISSGDLNGDGYSDVVVSAFLYDNTFSDEGAVFVYYGSPAGLPTAPDVLLTGGQAGAWFGYGVSVVGDINGDGYSDLVVGAPLYDGNGNVDEGAAFVYPGSASGIATTPVATLESNRVGSSFGDGIADAGDINGDGIDDFMIGSSLYSDGESAEGALFVYLGEGMHNHAKNDFDGDGKSDVLFLDTGTGSMLYWKDADHTQAVTASYYTGYRYLGTGDFDGDGTADILFMNTSNRGTIIWHGAAKSAATYPGTITAGFDNVAIGDFDGDGKDDILWSSPATGATRIWWAAAKSSVTYPGVQNAGYALAACADFDGDGKADIFWHNSTTGANQIWSSANKATKLYPGGSNDLTWTVVGAGDVDGDGKADLVWYVPATGAIHLWSAGLKSAPSYWGAGPAGFMPKAVGDYNGDRAADLLWGNDSTHALRLWPAFNKSAAIYLGTYPAGFSVQE